MSVGVMNVACSVLVPACLRVAACCVLRVALRVLRATMVGVLCLYIGSDRRGEGSRGRMYSLAVSVLAQVCVAWCSVGLVR